MKRIIIELNSEYIKLSLSEDNKSLDSIIWEGKANLSEELLTGIDSVLRKNNLKVGDISDFEVKSEIADQFTSVKIAEIVSKTLNFAKTVDKL